MSKLRVNTFFISADGYGAGPNQSLQDRLGVGGHSLHEWFVATRTFQTIAGGQGGTTGPDDDFAARGFENLGAWIPRAQHVRSEPRPVARRRLEGMVGVHPALPHAGVRADAPLASVHHDGRRHDVSFRHRWHRSRAATGEGSGGPKGRKDRRRRGGHSAVAASGLGRRNARRHRASTARLGRAVVDRPRPAEAWIQAHAACCIAQRHASCHQPRVAQGTARRASRGRRAAKGHLAARRLRAGSNRDGGLRSPASASVIFRVSRSGRQLSSAGQGPMTSTPRRQPRTPVHPGRKCVRSIGRFRGNVGRRAGLGGDRHPPTLFQRWPTSVGRRRSNT
jgi:hypothetical protein